MSVFGVDIGCYNSCVAMVRKGGIDVIINEVSKRNTLSWVSLTDQERCIGEAGFDRAVRNLANTVSQFKHLIGAHVDDPDFQKEKRFLTCNTVADENGRVKFDVSIGDESKELYPEQILAMYLHQLRSYVNREASADSGRAADVRDAVITVPSWYNADQRRCVQQACDIAGVHCMTLINETTSVAIDYGIFRAASLPETEEQGIPVALVGIGYGNTNVTVGRFWRNNVRILARECSKSISTREIDYLLYEHFAKEIQTKYKVDITENKRARLRVLLAVEKVKCMLSANRGAPLNIENLMDVDININSFTREEFESIIAPLIEEYKTLLKSTVEAAGLTVEQLHSVEMIGGGSRIPALKEATAAALKPPMFTVNATESVARGAAITAAAYSPQFHVREFVVHELPLLPVKAGHENPNNEAQPCVSFLPGVNDVVALLGPKDNFPKALDVTVKRRDEFHFHVFYDESAPNAAIANKQYRIGEWVIGKPSKSDTDGIVKVRANLQPSGLINCDHASTNVVTEVEVKPEEGKKAEGEAPKEGEPPKEGESPEKSPQKKTKKTKLELSCTPVFILGHSAEETLKMRKEEQDMVARDASILKTKEAKNELEAFIFENRSKIEKGGLLSDYVTDADRESFVKLSTEYENWLYEDGAESTQQEYESRLNALRPTADAALQRFRTHDDADFELKQYTERIKAFEDQLNKKEASKPSYITPEEFADAHKKIEDALAYGKDGVAALKSQNKTEAPKFTLSQFGSKLSEVSKDVLAVAKKKPPPAPKPAAPAPAADAKTPEPAPAEGAEQPKEGEGEAQAPPPAEGQGQEEGEAKMEPAADASAEPSKQSELD